MRMIYNSACIITYPSCLLSRHSLEDNHRNCNSFKGTSGQKPSWLFVTLYQLSIRHNTYLSALLPFLITLYQL